MTLYEKLLIMQTCIDKFVKDNVVGDGKAQYKAVGSEQVLETIRPLMNELNLLLIPSVESANVLTDKTASGTTRYFTELNMTMTWVDVESGEKLEVKWYGQGVDLAGEKGVGKANTYAEKYFFMKFFHVPTPKDDPDGDKRTKSGELKQKGTQAEIENIAFYKNAIAQILSEIYNDNEDKIKQALIVCTKNNARNYPGVDDIEKINEIALPIVYAKLKKIYEERLGKKFELAKN